MKLLQKLEDKDIIIHGTHSEKDPRGAGYNIGDMLNMPHMTGNWRARPHNNPGVLERMNVVGKNYDKSILHYYTHSRPYDERVPNPERILDSLKIYYNENKDKIKDIIQIISNENALVVHVRIGDRELEDEYVQYIYRLARKFDKVYIISGLHLDEYFLNNISKIDNFKKSLEKILKLSDKFYFILGEPDEHLCVMHFASNLLLHKGGFSTLGYIISTGKLYITKFIGDYNHSNWKIISPKKHIVI